MSVAIHIVWFKRDLRVQNHLPLFEACRQGVVLPVFAWEPTVLAGPDYARQHQVFAQESLRTLAQDLDHIGLSLMVWPAGIVDLLKHLRSVVQIAAIWSHEETGNQATYDVDKAVASWCRVYGTRWHEFPQHGVVRRLQNRNQWHGYWEQRMQSPLIPTPGSAIAAPLPEHILRSNTQIKPPLAVGTDKPARQKGGRQAGLRLLASFLDERAAHYRGRISSPLTSINSCSRLSPYLAWGCLSMREVVQATRERQQDLTSRGQSTRGLAAGLKAFESRLHWHCHFMQKLETEPALEFNNLHRGYDGIRESKLAQDDAHARLETWARGETGWPLVDACMAMLRQTGWLNFRMRAMLMSTASYLYWLHWREPGLHLAREFLDYEPGIHWPQVQMQSGTTGINTLRIYHPVKQAADQDPNGVFVRRWLPQLAQVPDSWILQPWLMPSAMQQRVGCVIGRDYPAPLVEIDAAMRHAKMRMSAVRQNDAIKAETSRVVEKHASRIGMPGSQRDANGVERASRAKRSSRADSHKQQELF